MSGTWSPPPAGPQRPSGPNPRHTAWIVGAVVLALILVRTHRLSTSTVMVFCALIPSVILHEVSHGVVALRFGDDTAKRAGRLTLNPVPHVDLFGTIILPAMLALSGTGVMFGWAKPVPVNVSRLRHPRNQNVAVALVGPAVNVALAVACGLAYHYGVPHGDKLTVSGTGDLIGPTAVQFLFAVGYINVVLAVFNLIPLPPLDGSAVVERLLPAPLLPGYYRIRPFTIFLPLAVMLLFPTALNRVFDPALRAWAHLLG